MAFKADGSKIRRWREERHWSQEHLADLAGIGVRTVQRIETGGQASRETLMALAAAFDVDALALCIDPEAKAEEIVQSKNRKTVADLRLSFLIHLAGYVCGMIVFAGISLGLGAFVMKWATIWWTVGLAGHGVTVAIVELVTRHQER